jgi:hypothetical protein
MPKYQQTLTFALVKYVKKQSKKACEIRRTTARSRSRACSALPALKYRALLGRIVVPGISAAHFWLRQKRREQAAVVRKPV